MQRSLAAGGTTSRPFALIIALAALSATVPISLARAAITPTGDVSPSNPSGWGGTTTGYIGNTASGTLTIDGGSDLVSGTGSIGDSSTGSGLVSVSGSGSTWASIYLNIGNSGSGTLSITSGGSVTTASDSVIGSYAGATGVAIVDGVGSTWSVANSLYAGNSGSGTLSVTNGGYVSSAGDLCVGCSGSGALSITDRGGVQNNGDGYVGFASGASGTVTVAGSFWANYGSLFVGNSGSGAIVVTGGGTVSSNYDDGAGYIGYAPGASGTITVAGTGSAWTDHSPFVGYGGSGVLSITNGGTVVSDYYLGTACIGYARGASGTATISGPGSTWWTTGYLYVGKSGSAVLSITNGGAVRSDPNAGGGTNGAYIGYSSGASGAVAVSGVGSTWAYTGSLYVGNSGTGIMSITNDGTASQGTYPLLGDSYIGYASGASGTVTVSGTGSTWTTATGSVFVGDSGSGVLSITNGATAVIAYPAGSSLSGYIGCAAGASGTVTISGVGSSWKASGAFYVGDSGSGALSISGGGTGISASGYIGYAPGASGTVTISGVGSAWKTALYVGNSGSGALSINGGGAGTSTYDYIGCEPGASGTLTISDTGSMLSSSFSYVGTSGSGALLIAGGGTATGATSYVGYAAGAGARLPFQASAPPGKTLAGSTSVTAEAVCSRSQTAAPPTPSVTVTSAMRQGHRVSSPSRASVLPGILPTPFSSASMAAVCFRSLVAVALRPPACRLMTLH